MGELHSYSTEYCELSGGGRNFLHVTEYALFEREFNLDEAIENEDNITNEEEFIKALKAEPNDYWDYCTDGAGWSLGYSSAIITAWVKIEVPNQEERYSIEYIEKEFNDFVQAKEWVNDKFEELSENEDSAGVYPVDFGLRF